MPNLYLIGMMGSGKSVTGRKLAGKLGYGFIDLDESIETRTKRKIADIFSKEGEPFFRQEEANALKEASKNDSRVVATGGGTILKHANVELMRATGKIILLETTPEVLWERVREKKDRPLLRGEKPQEKLLEIYAYRKPVYEGACDMKVNTDGKTAQAVAEEIYNLLQTKS